MNIEFGVKIRGKVSHFGGPLDTGVTETEGLALCEKVEEMPHLFLPEQPEGTIGLARRLDPEKFFCACRWDYSITPKSVLRKSIVRIVNPKNEKHCYAFCIDYGPHADTGRTIDVSQGVMKFLELETDDVVEHTLIKVQSVEA